MKYLYAYTVYNNEYLISFFFILHKISLDSNDHRYIGKGLAAILKES